MADASLAALNRALGEGIRQCKIQLNYTPSYFIRMLTEIGPVESVRRLTVNPHPSEGFTRLWEHGRLDLAVEFIALWPEFACFFGDVADAARRRLDKYGFDTETQLKRHVAGRPALVVQSSPAATSVGTTKERHG